MTDQKTIDNFVGLSAVLTGFARSVLKPDTDPQDQAGQYLSFLQSEESDVGDQLSGLLKLYFKNKDKSHEEIGKTIMASPFAELAKRIMKLWYTGVWYGPFDKQTGAPAEEVLSAQAYTNGLVWRAAQAHPMGYSELQFGYWEADPPPLKAFTGWKK